MSSPGSPTNVAVAAESAKVSNVGVMTLHSYSIPVSRKNTRFKAGNEVIFGHFGMADSEGSDNCDHLPNMF